MRTIGNTLADTLDLPIRARFAWLNTEHLVFSATPDNPWILLPRLSLVSRS